MDKIFSDSIIKSYFSLICEYPSSIMVFSEHDKCEQIGYIIEGKLELIHYTLEGEERVLATLSSGDLFGDFLINSKHPYYPGHLMTKETSRICYLEKANLNKLLVKNKKFRNYYLSQLSEKALNLNLHNKILMQPSLEEKIFMWLNHNVYEKENKIVKIKTKEALANYLNVTRPSLSRKLKELKSRGLIEYGKNFIKIL
ncbi:MAG: Crp/Fnr family transcriptional regulator [Candidatus Izimaplasma sp.]|nr:Crp/Fnr family transcriptional regulator [Candidatus Izimaplasma bacterium]